MKLPAVLLLLLVPVFGWDKFPGGKPKPGNRQLVETSSTDALRRRSLGSLRHLGGSMPVPPPPSSKGKPEEDEDSGKGKGGSAPKSDGKGKGGGEVSSKSGGKGKGGGSKSGGKGKGGSKGASKSGGKGKGGSKSGGKGKGGSKSEGKGKGGSKSEGKGKGGSKGSKGKGKGGPDSGKGKGGPDSGKGKGDSSGDSGKGKGDSGKGKGDSGKGKGDSGKGKGDSGKGKGGVPEGKGKGGVATCTVVPILFYNEDLLAGEYTNDVGFGLNSVPFFDPETLEQLGTYSDFAVDVPDSEECIASGAFSFGTPDATGKYPTQVEISFTCGSQQNAVTGGTGEYGCASGYEEFAFQDETAGLLGTELTICGPLCPAA